MFFSIYLFLSVVTTEVNEMTSSIQFRSKSATAEPLLRFPFVHTLANPCGFQLMEPATPNNLVTADAERHQNPANHVDTLARHRLALAPLRDVREDIPLDQQVLDFLGPFREIITSVNQHSLNETKMNKDQSRQELQLVVSQALLLIRRIYSPSALRKCKGFQLESLSRNNLSVVFSRKGGIQLEELYRSLMIISAHSHVMIRDVHHSTTLCPTESFAKLQILRQLTGKLETTMCLILHSAIVTEKYENLNYFSVTRNVLQSYVHRYYTCSARELQSCLVLRNAYKIFYLIQRHFSAEGKCRSPQGGQTWEDGMAMASLIQNKQIVCK